MRSPTLKELPPPPPDRTGWPWTVQSPPLSAMTPDGYPWPAISIVAPSYNQAAFIEETIRSVLLQGYPNLEFIIIDGGSTDGTIDIIRRYEPWLAAWVSEPDRGQSHAINKGFARSHGDVLAWINTDDTYEPGALAAVGAYLAAHPAVDVLYGNARIVDAAGRSVAELRSVPFHPRAFLHNTVHIPVQSAVFWRRDLFFRAGMVDEGLHYAMDVDLLVRFLHLNARFAFIRQCLGAYRHHGSSKTVASQGASGREAAGIGAVAAARDHPLYRFRRFCYRLRQLGLLVGQGDLMYLLSRLAGRFQRRVW